MKHLLLFVVAFLYLLVTLLPPSCADTVAQEASFKATIDRQRTLNIEGTDAAETIIMEVTDEPASVAIEYRKTDGTGTPQKASFLLSAFDRLVVNARGGADFVNIIDAAELLDTQKKTLNLNGGEGDNIVVVSHLPFRPETARQIMRLLNLSSQLEDIAKRAGEATSQALVNEAMKLIESVRVNLADVSKSLAADAEKQLFDPAREMVERSGPQLTDLGNSLSTRRDNLAKQHSDFIEELTKKYGPPAGGYPPDDDSEPANLRPDADRPDSDPAKEKEANDVRVRAEQLAQTGLKLGDDAKAQIEQRSQQMESNAAGIERQAAEFERKAEELAARAETLAAQGERDMTAASDRVLAVVAELRLMERSFQEAGMALHDELLRAVSMTPTTKPNAAKVAASGCNTPIVTTHNYTGGGSTDFFFPFAAPTQSWSINGGGGSDFLFGGFAADNINGGPGNDVICGLKGDDHIHGDDGTDFLFGEFFIDFPFLTGSDCIWGDKGVDLVVGDNFIDTASGTPGGDDNLWGGDGTDIVIGDDVLEVPNFPNFNVVTLEIFSQTHPGGSDEIEGNDGTDILFGCGGSDPKINGNNGMDFAEGNGGDDVIDGGDGQNFSLCNTTIDIGNLLLGGDGNDDVTGGAGIDVIFGNLGDDKLTGKDQVDLMFGNPGKDMMHGDAGGTICVVNSVPIRLGNLMLGGTEDDKMWAGGDLDIMFGEAGDDELRGYDGSLQQPFAADADLLFGGSGNDYLQGDNEALTLMVSVDFMFGGPGIDDMHGGRDIDFMFGGPGPDHMYGDSNSLLLVASIDLMFGGSDDDWMDGGNGLDLMFGGDGNDTMLGDDETAGLISSDFMFGNSGDDTMNGGCSSDFMFGNDGADHMLGDSNYLWEPFSNDFMFGGSGSDYMDGGNAMDFMFGGPDCDTMLGDNSLPGRITIDFMFGNTGNDNMDGGDSPDFMWGGDGDDQMVGDQGFWWQLLSSDIMFGNDGCDTMLGGRALDLMWGDRGVDHMDGQQGPDIIVGGDNSDIIDGGDLIDLIWGNNGNDLIHGGDWPDFIWGNDGNDCLYGDDGQDFIWGDQGNDCLHGGSHVDLLFGNDGDDLIFGDDGRDLLFGGSGDDKLDGGGSFDVIFGGSGQDEGWRGPGGAVFFSVATKHNGSSGLDCDCQIEVCRGKLCVHKFNDLNGDGIQNNGEPGLPNWSFTVTASCVGGSLITDANGNACGDFSAGTYTIVEQPQSGWMATTPTTQTVTVTVGQTTNISFGNRQDTGMLCIHKFNDSNGNGVRDPGEPGLPNWSFTATNSSGASTSFVTLSNGVICHPLPVGTYTVVETAQSGWTATTPTTQTVTITANAETDVDFGNWRPVNQGMLCIHKFNDSNGNGIQDANEPGVPGFVFQISVGGGVMVLTSGTDGTICTSLPPGTYTVTESPKPGWTATTPTTQTVTVTAGQTTNISFGNHVVKGEPGKLCILKFNDVNGNGVQDGTETALPNFVFQVSGGNTITMVTTGPNGIICTGFPAGTYTVVEQTQSGWITTTPTTQIVTVNTGGTTNVSFGNRQAFLRSTEKKVKKKPGSAMKK
ncbi:MAG: serralysin [Blastocatellia bacterium]